MKIQVSKERQATQSDNRYAAAKIGFVPNGARAAMATAARQAGMTRVAPGQYQAKDNSWIMMDAEGRVERGRGETKWIGLPSRAAGTSAGASRSYTVDHMLKTALGKLPFLSGSESQDAPILRENRFIKRGMVYRHADGSAVDYSNGYARLEYKGVDLSLLPRWW